MTEELPVIEIGPIVLLRTHRWDLYEIFERDNERPIGHVEDYEGKVHLSIPKEHSYLAGQVVDAFCGEIMEVTTAPVKRDSYGDELPRAVFQHGNLLGFLNPHGEPAANGDQLYRADVSLQKACGFEAGKEWPSGAMAYDEIVEAVEKQSGYAARR